MSDPTTGAGVLLVDLAAAYGGAETRVLETARGLGAGGVATSVVCLRDSPLHRRLAEADVPALPVASSKWDPLLPVRLARLVRAHPGWVVDAHNAQSQLVVHLASWRRANAARCIATVHSEYDRSERRTLGLSLHQAVLRRTIRAGWPLVAVSTSVAAALERLGAPSGDVSVVWSGVDGGNTDDCQAARARARRDVHREEGLAADDFVVTVVGRLVPVKNVELAVRAVARLHRDLSTARLLVVGDGPERARLEALAADQGLPPGRVRFLGHRQDVARVLAASDVMAITSTTEGLPYVLLEAAACGTPVVSTRVGAIAELFGDGAVALLPPGTETRPEACEALADLLLRLALDPAGRRGLARRAAEVQRRELSTEAMLSSTLEVYDQYAQIRPTAGSHR